MESGDLVAQAALRGQQLLDGFLDRLAGQPGVTSIRGRGMMIGIELERPCAELVGRAIERGLLINVTAGRVVRLLPPLITTENQAKIIVDQVSELIIDFLAEPDA
jgi:acetylornithine aminotransferase